MKLSTLGSIFSFLAGTNALTLNIASSGGNKSSSLLYGLLYEDIYHSGDGGLYGELIRNRAFQGSSANRVASLDRNTDYWHPVGEGVTLEIDTSSPALSSSLPYQMRVDVPAGTTGRVGFYNDGFWGFNVDATQEYIASLYMRGEYSGTVETYFHSSTSDSVLGSTTTSIASSAGKWTQGYSPVFHPTASGADANNTFYFTFDGAQLAGKSIYVNLLSVFKQTYKNRINGVRTDLAEALDGLSQKYIRLPGGNNMEGLYSPYYWKWNETIGDLVNRPGRPGTWGDINTDGFGLVEQMQLAEDLGLEVILGVWAGLYLNGQLIAEADLDPYVDQVMDELEFLLGDTSTTYGSLRASLGHPAPYKLAYIEVGNEDYLNGGTSSYYAYRYAAFHNAISAAYPTIPLISTINPNPINTEGAALDLHIYGNQAYFASLFGTFDQASRSYPVFVNEYAATNTGSNTRGEIGAQTLGMACAEAIFLLGCERNSDVVVGSAYGALIKSYDEEPGTVAVIKHTANEVLRTMSYYVQKLFAENMGSETVPVSVNGGGFGPVYWSATRDAEGKTILKLVNYGGEIGEENAVQVVVEGSSAGTATLTSLTADSVDSVNNLEALGGEASVITTTTLQGNNGVFSVAFDKAYEIVILVV
ncbi:glycoside hydrolase superfamily [Aspergillus pseudoustus]|uniref:non-reducing end alpha-L-arabinofuranosidase n=1 Tax=Aspergillus pseudoustus TaxID=1810923 RepID=A0ABR4KIK5_9EURO